jgi:hypothetical protein
MIEWQDPPPKHRRGTVDWASIVAELSEHPGKWALILTDANKVNSRLGYLKSRYGLEIRTQINADGTYKLWARVPE